MNIPKLISWILSQGLLALVCWPVYHYLLSDLVGIILTYWHWLGIIIIASCVFPSGRVIKPNLEAGKSGITKKQRFKNLLDK